MNPLPQQQQQQQQPPQSSQGKRVPAPRRSQSNLPPSSASFHPPQSQPPIQPAQQFTQPPGPMHQAFPSQISQMHQNHQPNQPNHFQRLQPHIVRTNSMPANASFINPQAQQNQAQFRVPSSLPQQIHQNHPQFNFAPAQNQHQLQHQQRQAGPVRTPGIVPSSVLPATVTAQADILDSLFDAQSPLSQPHQSHQLQQSTQYHHFTPPQQFNSPLPLSHPINTNPQQPPPSVPASSEVATLKLQISQMQTHIHQLLENQRHMSNQIMSLAATLTNSNNTANTTITTTTTSPPSLLPPTSLTTPTPSPPHSVPTQTPVQLHNQTPLDIVTPITSPTDAIESPPTRHNPSLSFGVKRKLDQTDLTTDSSMSANSAFNGPTTTSNSLLSTNSLSIQPIDTAESDAILDQLLNFDGTC
ncbi:hypothetical protein BCR33DRAFT_773144 [Rhizoclosmatium globosum]|uniref:Uncharacterized protein n=1 Tax=Rhizoclosmatium globosum TaxID=329046 RepID=A0A1Y2AZA4_9FUNG|nr:hypothetical protein BCR33DRAFT_773144 [Rhizoclosmatium globosum]|eukprot:ORY27567.1 hypothetical protein BCR33DRAFT_773144 [Rhizoclosmatium globosum]